MLIFIPRILTLFMYRVKSESLRLLITEFYTYTILYTNENIISPVLNALLPSFCFLRTTRSSITISSPVPILLATISFFRSSYRLFYPRFAPPSVPLRRALTFFLIFCFSSPITRIKLK